MRMKDVRHTWCRLASAIAATIGCLSLPSVAVAQTAPNAVHMTGSAQADASSGQVFISTPWDDSSTWRFTVALSPDAVPGQLRGPFAIASPNGIRATGQADGTLNLAAGQGELTLRPDFGNPLVADITLNANVAAIDVTMASGSVPLGSASQDNNQLYWYVSRITGLTAYSLLFASMCLGLAIGNPLLDGSVARWRSFDLHQLTSLLAIAVAAVHVLSLLGDHFIGFSIRQLLVPFASAYQPFWVGMGILAFYVSIVVTASFWLRKRIGNRTWKALHALSYGVFVLALAHGVFAGNDNASWAKLLYWGTGLILAMLTLWRVAEGRAHRRLRSLIAS